jgi:glyoxylase I family protein
MSQSRHAHLRPAILADGGGGVHIFGRTCTMPSPTSPTMTLQHVALSVRDIDKSTEWYTALFGLDVVASFDEPAAMKVLMSPQMQAIDLRQDPAVVQEDFTQERVGLDHVGFVLTDRAELDTWLARLEDYGVEHSQIVESPFGLHLNFRDPDRIPLEFFLPASG